MRNLLKLLALSTVALTSACGGHNQSTSYVSAGGGNGGSYLNPHGGFQDTTPDGNIGTSALGGSLVSGGQVTPKSGETTPKSDDDPATQPGKISKPSTSTPAKSSGGSITPAKSTSPAKSSGGSTTPAKSTSPAKSSGGFSAVSK